MNSMLKMVTTALGPSEEGHMRYCGTCGYQNPGNISFCLNCTVPLGNLCPACGQTAQTGSKFCGQCGVPLTDTGLSPQPSSGQKADSSHNLLTDMPTALVEKIKTASIKLPGERRDVTVLLAEVMDFTASVAAANLHRESLYLFIDEAISLLADVAYKYDGTIDKFTSDGLMVIFGAPVAHENDPELAIRAALDMLTTLHPLRQRFKETHGFEVQVRIGISTGGVIAGRLGNDVHMEYTVVGDAVDLTVRLKQAAEPGTILVSSETYRRTNTIFEFETILAAANPNGQHPSPSFRPTNLLESPNQARWSSNSQLPLIGRTDELVQLEQTLEQVRRDKQRRIVQVTGEAGIGKSRLIAEFRDKIAALDIRVYQSQCLAYTRSRALWVVAEMLRAVLGISEKDPTTVKQETIERYLKQRGLAQDEIWPYLANILGLEQIDQGVKSRLKLLDGTMLQRQVHLALRKIFLAEARSAPTIFVFEDLHWIDSASRDFLEHLIQTTSDEAFLIVLVFRVTELSSSFGSLLTVIKKEAEQLVDLSLEPLSNTNRQLLVDQFIRQNTPEAQLLKQKIIQSGGGNPFYIGEIIRMLIDQGGLKRECPNKDWQVTPQATKLLGTVPGTIKDLILARFDSLPEGLRRTLQLAAVLGTAFPTALLCSISGLDADTLTLHLNKLAERQLLRFEPFNSEEGCVFQHALFQDVIYGTLLKRDRRQIHDQVARIIEHSETWPPVEKIELLAYHYFESTHPVKAAPHLIIAAEKAAQRCAYEIAIEQYRRVILLLPAPPNASDQEFFQVRVGLGRSLKYVGEFVTASQLLTESLQQLWSSSLALQSATLWPVLVEILRQLADIRQREGAYAEALDYLETGLQVLGETGITENPGLWSRLIERQAWIHFRQGRLEKAFQLADSTVKRLTSAKIDDPVMIAKLFNTLGGVCWQQGHREQAIEYAQRSLALFQSIGYLWGVATACNNLGILYDVLGNWAKGAEYHQRAYALQIEIGDIEGQGRSLDNLGVLHLSMGQHQSARQEIETSLAVRQKLGDRYGIAQSYASLAELALTAEDLEQALTNAEAALKQADMVESVEIQVYARWIKALIQAKQGDLESGLKLAEQAQEMAHKAGFVEGEIDSLRVWGILQAQAKAHQEAQNLFRSSAELALKYNDPYRQGLAWLQSGQTYQSLAQTSRRHQHNWRAKAVIALNQAAQIFETLGAAHHHYLAQTALSRLQLDRSIEE